MKIMKILILLPFTFPLLLPYSSFSNQRAKTQEILEGTVVSEEMSAIKDASIILLDDSFLPLQISFTNERGEFHLVGNSNKASSLRVQKEGYLPYDIKNIPAYLEAESSLIVLIRSSSLSGTIRDGVHYSPIIDSELEVFQRENERASDSLLIKKGKSDEKGEFLLEHLSTGSYLLEAHKEGFIHSETAVQLKKGERKVKDLFLFKKGVLKGYVKDPEENPISDARIEIMREMSAFFKGRENFFKKKAYQTISSRNGSFALQDIPEFVGYLLSISADGYAPRIISQDIRSGFNTVQIILNRGSSLSGTLKDSNGDPVCSAIIRIKPLNQKHLKALKNHFEKSYHPSGSGHFKIKGLPEGSYTMSIDSQEFLPFHLDAVDLKAGEDNDLGILTLFPGLAINGTVENYAGEKIKSSKVTATLSGSTGKKFCKESESKEDGSFTISGLKEGIYTVSTRAKNYAVGIKRGIRAGTTQILIKLTPAGKIKGTCRDASGNPLERFSLFVQPEKISHQTAEGKYFIFSSKTGHYEIDSLDPGFYSLRAGAEGYYEETLTGVEVTEGDEREEIDFVLDRGGHVEGYVYDQELDLPVIGASVSLFGRETYQALTDSEGYFQLIEIPMKTPSLMIKHPDYAFALVDHIDSSRTGSSHPMKIFLEKGGTVEGYVQDADDSPIHGAFLSITEKGHEVSSFSDISGFYRLEHIPSGKHRLVKVLPKGDIYSDYDAKIVDIQNNESLRIDFKSSMEVLGRLLKKSMPVGGARVSFIESPEQAGYDTSQLSARTSYTDSAGSYKISHLHEGRYSIVVEKGEKRFVKNTTIPKVKEFHCDIYFPEHEISGRVSDAESHEPLPYSKVASIPSTTSSLVVFESQQLEKDGSLSTIAGATSDMQSSLTDADGVFILPVEKTGKYTISATSQRYVSQSKEVVVRESTAAFVDFALEKSAALRGSIRNASGGIPSAAIVYLRWNNNSKAESIDADGKFFFDDLKPGLYSLLIIAKDLAPLILDQYKVESGKDHEEEFLLNQGGPFKIIVTPADQPFHIQILDARGRDFYDLFMFYIEEEVSFHQDKTKQVYAFPPLPPGRYKIILTSQELSQEKFLEIYDGIASSIKFEL